LLAFFRRIGEARYRFDAPSDLLRLLATMIRNKLLQHAEAEQAACRDRHRRSDIPVEERQLADPASTPSEEVADRELRLEAGRRLHPSERRLLELRQQGNDWADIAEVLGGTPEALRKKLCRALGRIRVALGLA